MPNPLQMLLNDGDPSALDSAPPPRPPAAPLDKAIAAPDRSDSIIGIDVPPPSPPSSFNIISARSLKAREAEAQRKAQLESDPLADLIDAFSVRCKRCNATLKLSPKSTYELDHWLRHRGRCLKRSEAEIATAQSKPPPKRRQPRVSIGGLDPVVAAETISAASAGVGLRQRGRARRSDAHQPGRSSTPPLMRDSASRSPDPSSSSGPADPSPPPPDAGPADAAFETFFAPSVVPPPRPDPADARALDGAVGEYQARLAHAMGIEPVRVGEWHYGHLKRPVWGVIGLSVAQPPPAPSSVRMLMSTGLDEYERMRPAWAMGPPPHVHDEDAQMHLA